MKMETDDFRLFVKNEREKQNMSTRQLSDLINKSPSYISQLERGLVKEPPIYTAEKILAALGHDSDILGKFRAYMDTSVNNKKTKVLYDVDMLKGKLKEELVKKIDTMETKDIAGLLQLLNTERDIVWQLATIRADVKKVKIPFVLESIRNFILFMKNENKINKNE